jgi:hypothetical protein
MLMTMTTTTTTARSRPRPQAPPLARSPLLVLVMACVCAMRLEAAPQVRTPPAGAAAAAGDSGGPGPAATGTAAPVPLTRPEASDYRETSTLDDVRVFFRELQLRGAPIALESMGALPSGRDIPLVVVAHPPVANAIEARRAGKLVVYLQANIHGGEVEGKEVAQVLVRELANGQHQELLQRLVLLVAPVFNADGNESWGDGLEQRAHQNGPARVGARANGQRLDLNRDCMKARAAETQAVLRAVYRAWDPDAVLDLHTTNGTRHGYPLTYSPPLCPGGDAAVLEFARDRLLPRVRARMRERHGLETFDYGNVETVQGERAWYSFGAEPRYVTNYAGVRGRLGILSEATSYLPFRERIAATRWFVLEVLSELAASRTEVAALVSAADARAVEWGLHPERATPVALRHRAGDSGALGSDSSSSTA